MEANKCSFCVVFFFILLISVLSLQLQIQLSEGVGYPLTVTFLHVFPTRIWISNALCHVLFVFNDLDEMWLFVLLLLMESVIFIV